MKLIACSSIVEQVVDVLVGDLGERRIRAGLLHLLEESLEDVVELLARLLHAKTYEPEARPRVEDHDQDDAIAHQLDVNVRLLTLVELGGEFVLLEELRHSTRRRDISRGERSQAGRIDVVDIASR